MLEQRLSEHRSEGRPLPCSEQILLEAKWVINYRDDWTLVDRRLDDLERSLDTPQKALLEQSEDGSWAACADEFYRKLEPTVDMLQTSGADSLIPKPLAFMSRLLEPKRLLDYLFRLQVSDIARTGRNNRDELGAVQTALCQLMFKDELRDILSNPAFGFQIPRDVETIFIDYLEQTQHPQTGYWGPWYRFRDELYIVQDLSFTFHIIKYRSGNVSRWKQIIDSTLETKRLVYPMGWKPGGDAEYSDHHNYDVVVIFYYGWPYMSAAQKEAARREIRDMLDWCLTRSIQGDGFGPDGGDIDAYYFGVRFLDRCGFWDPAKRFWIRKEPAQPPGMASPVELCRRLRTGFERLNDRSEQAETVRSILMTAECTSRLVSSS